MASLSKTKAKLRLRNGDSEAFLINVPSGATVQSAVWKVSDIAGNTVTLPGFNGMKQYIGARAEFDNDGFYLRAGDAPTYAQLTIKVTVTVKPAKGAVTTQTLSATVNFTDSWGGMAKSWYPYPENYEMSWTADPKGRRAVALLHEMIALLPEEYRIAAGPIPIIRTGNPKSLRGEEYRGANLPFFFDTIQISTKLVDKLTIVPKVTPADIEFVAVVVHEIAHAVTYRKCLWDVHHAMADARKLARAVFPGVLAPIGWAHTLLAGTHGAITALAQNLIAPQDVVSEFSEVAGWELTSWLARVVRFVQVPASLMDLGQWLWRLPGQGFAQDYPIRPNLVVGNAEIGGAFGLRARPLATTQDAYNAALSDYNAKKKAYDAALPKERAKLKKGLDAALAAYTKAEAAFRTAKTQNGFVSDYAAYDALEDMAETLTFYLMDAADLAKLGEYYGDRANAVLRGKRKFFADQQYLPQRDFPPLKIGSMWRGLDAIDHLDKWEVEL